jgi:hypothetical protein
MIKGWMIFALAGIGALLAFWAVMKPILDDNKVRGKVLNFSEGMKDYYFLPEAGEAETLAALAALPEQQVVDFSFCPETATITFRRDNVEADYRLSFPTAEGKTGLRVSRVAEEREPGNIPYLVNAFFIKNLRAKPVDYRRFEAMFSGEKSDEA